LLVSGPGPEVWFTFTIRAAMDLTGWNGARPPRREPLEGVTVHLEPLDAARHGDDLFDATAGADDTWRYLPYGPFSGKPEFMRWLAERAAMSDPLAFAIVDRSAQAARGIATFMSIVPEHGVIEIGHIWFSPRLQRTRQATEAIFVMSRYAFDELGNRRLEWKCSNENAGSKRAAERFGFTFEGVFRQHRVDKGRNRDTAWYSIIDPEWPSRRAAFEAWLASSNFDAEGKQRRSLAEVRSALNLAS
jgi:RimJ/RimL family protein N-acetyltransferase